jgi:hypothetical protein
MRVVVVIGVVATSMVFAVVPAAVEASVVPLL